MQKTARGLCKLTSPLLGPFRSPSWPHHMRLIQTSVVSVSVSPSTRLALPLQQRLTSFTGADYLVLMHAHFRSHVGEDQTLLSQSQLRRRFFFFYPSHTGPRSAAKMRNGGKKKDKSSREIIKDCLSAGRKHAVANNQDLAFQTKVPL